MRQRARDHPADLRDLEAVGQADAEMVAVGRDEDLGLAGEAAEGDRMDDPVAVALERAARPAAALVRLRELAPARLRRDRRHRARGTWRVGYGVAGTVYNVNGRRTRVSRCRENPLGRLLGVDAGAVVDRQHVGIDVDHHLELGAGEHDRLGAVLLLDGDHRLERALGVAGHLADHQLVVDDPVELSTLSRSGGSRSIPCATSRRR